MFEKIISFFKNLSKKEQQENPSKDTAKERLHLVLMQDRANVSADFLELMKQEIIEVIKKYVDVDEKSIDVRLTNKPNDDGSNGAPALYANIPIVNVRNDMKKEVIKENEKLAYSKEDEDLPKEHEEVLQEVEEIIEDTNKEENEQNQSDIPNENTENIATEMVQESHNEEEQTTESEMLDNTQESKINDNIQENVDSINENNVQENESTNNENSQTTEEKHDVQSEIKDEQKFHQVKERKSEQILQRNNYEYNNSKKKNRKKNKKRNWM